jgi:hypothetical protein
MHGSCGVVPHFTGAEHRAMRAWRTVHPAAGPSILLLHASSVTPSDCRRGEGGPEGPALHAMANVAQAERADGCACTSWEARQAADATCQRCWAQVVQAGMVACGVLRVVPGLTGDWQIGWSTLFIDTGVRSIHGNGMQEVGSLVGSVAVL